MINENDKQKIKELYFEKLKDFDEIQKILQNKYTYNEIRNFIMSTYK